ncbi:hypothetical protein FA15DRAFT_625229 [Coprinopsis marcescibilis]|uniref:DUF5648 domain-containing protein n=1 Tax=Coprinopsis marcescibilis TaxID=230819 RepID=A0A5C3KKX7_COPMA|nr:hypothetical protein FA15DRAFT_625229 [Coprinopsis marcescibilis]
MSNPDFSPQHADPRDSIPLYRFFDSLRTDHIYSTQNTLGTRTSIAEGIACYVFPTQVVNTTPLYLIYRCSKGCINHFYTTNLLQREELVAKYPGDWEDRGIVAFVFKDGTSGGVPLHQLLNAAGGDHMYTVSESEREAGVAKGFKYEGVIGYVYPGTVI